jgi:hypothetical protein
MRPPVGPDRVELHFGPAFEARPGERAARARDVHNEASGRQRLDEGDHVPRHAAVPGLRREQETAV